MFLSDADIVKELEGGELVVEPIEDEAVQIQPAGIDVRLDNEFLRFNRRNTVAVNPLTDGLEEYMSDITINDNETLCVHPGDFILASTIERVEIPHDIVSFVNGRSTLGRLAIVVHATAGLLDPGFSGDVTLEISNLGSVPIELTPGMRIAQLTFSPLSSPAKRPYGENRGSKYQGQSGVQHANPDGPLD